MIVKTILRQVVNLAKRVIKPYVQQVKKNIPKVELSEMHLRNAKLIATREELLDLLPKNAVVAELGVDEGGFSQKIVEIARPKKLHLVDFWGSKRYNLEKQKKVYSKFALALEQGIVEINLGYSTQVVSQFPDGYFDWVYIDTDHTYKTTYEELNAYMPKLKPNGILCGHDYVDGILESATKYGVIEAVHQFCVEQNFEILYLTTELSVRPSFAIRRI
ncbi:MAG: class I SAM-dependent methyltransferase [Luteibaculaceae bacterium]